ncbi:14-alpha sterol demethylase Cyp51B, partial [Aureobasidium melanogenum]
MQSQNQLNSSWRLALGELEHWKLASLALLLSIGVAVLVNAMRQVLFQKKDEPPVVFHWFPFIGSTVAYGMDSYGFFFSNRSKYGDIFTFVLLGKQTTVYLGTKGNEFILNGKLKDLNAEDTYSPLTTPVFGQGVVYDCSNAMLMQQKKFIKHGLTTASLQSHVSTITHETGAFFAHDASHKRFSSQSGTFDLPAAMAELTINTASRSLQGQEARDQVDSTFAHLYHDLYMEITPINFMLPWAPLLQNRRRDRAQKKMADTYKAIIQQKRSLPCDLEFDQGSMLRNLMTCQYKDGTALTDQDIAHIMIALLMAGQHSSSSTISWILLCLASRPDIQEELLQEQKNMLGINQDGFIKDLRFEDLPGLKLHGQVIKETLRLHAPMHSILRKVRSSMPVPGTSYTIPAAHTLLATPGTSSCMQEHFPEPLSWGPHRWDELPSEDYSNFTPNQSKLNEKEEIIDYGYGLVIDALVSSLLKQQTHHPDYFCTWYLSDPRTHSPLPQLSPDALFSACKCIVNAAPSGTWSQATNGIYKAARMESFVPAGCPTGFSDFINDEFVDARAFCQFWHYCFPDDFKDLLFVEKDIIKANPVNYGTVIVLEKVCGQGIVHTI